MEKPVCDVCKEHPWKYRCPVCSIRSCGLDCVKSHKHRTGCTGKRKFEVVPISQSDDNLLLSDNNMEKMDNPVEKKMGNHKPVCEVCKLHLSKYKCPVCSTRSCGLDCLNSHKQRTGCRGNSELESLRTLDFHLPQELLVEIMARLPLKSISRNRSVSKEWKAIIDSHYFRDHSISCKSSASVSWSIIQTRPYKLSLEIVGHRGCERWGLQRSPASFMRIPAETTTIKRLRVLACTDGLVSVVAENMNGSFQHYIVKVLWQEWSPIPCPRTMSYRVYLLSKLHDRLNDTGLVTKMQNGIVVSYKIVWIWKLYPGRLDITIYSSELGRWKVIKIQNCPHFTALAVLQGNSIGLNGILHWLSQDTTASSIVARDFYSGGTDGFCVVKFPGGEVGRFPRRFTTSEGFLVHVNETVTRMFQIWRLVKYTEDGSEQAWQLLWETFIMDLIPFDYFPMVMHPLKSDIIYMWSRSEKGLIVFNLTTETFRLHKESRYEQTCEDGSIVSFNSCSDYMEANQTIYGQIYEPYPGKHLLFSQFVLPRWLLHHLK